MPNGRAVIFFPPPPPSFPFLRREQARVLPWRGGVALYGDRPGAANNRGCLGCYAVSQRISLMALPTLTRELHPLKGHIRFNLWGAATFDVLIAVALRRTVQPNTSRVLVVRGSVFVWIDGVSVSKLVSLAAWVVTITLRSVLL